MKMAMVCAAALRLVGLCPMGGMFAAVVIQTVNILTAA